MNFGLWQTTQLTLGSKKSQDKVKVKICEEGGAGCLLSLYH